MQRPSFQFYAADWIGSANLRRCTHAEKGIWIDVMCLMHDSNEYGVLRWSLKEIAQAVGCRLADLKALIDKGVLKGAGAGELCEACIYVPRTGRKNGNPVTLIDQQNGPIYYSSRMVRDEYVRKHAGATSRFKINDLDGYEQDNYRYLPDDLPAPSQRHGEWQGVAPSQRRGDGSSSSSSSSSTKILDTAAARSKQNSPDPLGETEQRHDPPEKNPPSGKTPKAESASHEDATVAAVSARALDIAVLLKQRGVIIPPGDVRMRRWAQDGISDAVLLAALETATLRRASRGCSNPVNAGLIDSILADAQAPPARASPRGKQAAREAYLDAAATSAKKHGFDVKGGDDGRHERDISGEYSRVT